MSRTNQHENFYKRLKELGGIKSGNHTNSIPSLSNSTLLEFSRANDGTALGIVKENHSYFIKKSSNQAESLGVEDFTYIGGVENKHKYMYGSVAEAKKNQNFYLHSLNESLNRKMAPIGMSKVRVITEGEALSTADSQIKPADIMANKSDSKENAQAPINDTNAKTKANTGVGQPSPLATADSEIKEGDFMPNKTGKENAQAPVNDTNAKSKANSGSGQPNPLATSDSEIEKSDFIANKTKSGIAESKALATADSEIKKSDSMSEKKR